MIRISGQTRLLPQSLSLGYSFRGKVTACDSTANTQPSLICLAALLTVERSLSYLGSK